jgi:hypothetical protein
MAEPRGRFVERARSRLIAAVGEATITEADDRAVERKLSGPL